MSAEESWLEVHEPDPGWPAAYAEEAAAIRETLGSYAVEIAHFGSTSVPGLASKPIVDILVGTRIVGVPTDVLTSLAALGYKFLGEDGRRPGRFFFRKRADRSFNLSLVPALGELWRENLRIRDFLRANPDWVERYAEVKRRALAASQHSLLGYQDSKRAFMDDLRREALAWSVSDPGRASAGGPAAERLPGFQPTRE